MADYNNKGYAVVLPNSTPSAYEVQQDLLNRADRRRQEDLLQQQREQARQASLMQYMGNTLDPKDYDGLLHTKLQDLQGKYTQAIRQNPGMNTADLSLLMQKDLTGLSQWNQALKLGQQNIEAQGDAYKEYKNIDVANAKRKALSSMLFEHDPNGNLITENGQPKLKDPSTIDFNKNYINDELFGPQGNLYLSGKPDWNALLSKMPKNTVGDSYQRRSYGPGKPLVTKKFTADLYPFQDVVTDKDGERNVVTRGEDLGGKKMIDAQTFDAVTKNPDFRIQLQNDFSDYMRQHGLVKDGKLAFAFNSPEGQQVQRMMVYDQLDQQAPKKIVREDGQVAPNYHFTNVNNIGSDAKLSHPVDYWMDAVRNGKSGDVLPQMGGKWLFPDGKGGFHEAKSISVDADGTSHITYERGTGKNDILSGKEKTETVTKDVSPSQLKGIIEKSMEANSGKDPYKNREVMNRWFTGVQTPTPKKEQSFNLNADQWRKK